MLKNIKKGLKNMQILNNIKVIGIGGLARAGKDTFVGIAKNILTNNGYNPIRVAFADSLKDEVSKMLITNGFSTSVRSDDTEIKKLMRPLMVWWGCQRRRESPNGAYWITEAEAQIKKHSELEHCTNGIDYDKLVFLISDVRFPNEVEWIHNKFDGEVIHLKRWKAQKIKNGDTTFIKQYDLPPNEEEALQDPLVQKISDYHVEWEDAQKSSSGAVEDDVLKQTVLSALNKTKYFRHTTNGTLL